MCNTHDEKITTYKTPKVNDYPFVFFKTDEAKNGVEIIPDLLAIEISGSNMDHHPKVLTLN